MCSLLRLPGLKPLSVIVSLIKPLNFCGLQFLHLLSGTIMPIFPVVVRIKLN